MVRHDEIQSTEKLLELIRNPDRIDALPGITIDDSSSLQNTGRASLSGPVLKPNKRSIAGAVRLRKKIVIGIDIGHTYIKLAKIQHNSDKSVQLQDYLDIPLQKSFSLNDPKILQLLKTTIQKFRGSDSNADIWSAITSAQVETRLINIPKLPGRQIYNAVFWTFTKKVPLNQADEVLDYEILGDITEGGVKKTEIMAYKAPREEIETLKKAFQSIGYPLKGISVVPFAIQNLLRTNLLAYPHENVCCLFVGRNWSRITVYDSGNLVLSRGIRAGMRSMIEAIDLSLAQSENDWCELPGDEAENMRRDHATTINPVSQKLFFDFIASSAASSDAVFPKGYSLDRVFQMLLPAMERLIRQIERTFEHYSLNFQHEGVRRIFISGPVTASKSVVDHIGRQLDLPISVLDPFGGDPVFSEPVNIPKGAADRESFVPCIGLALSNNQRTPNFLFTHQNKEQAERVRSNNMRVLTVCLLCLIFLIAVFSWQERRLDQKRATVARLSDQLINYTPPAEKDNLLALYAKTKSKRRTVRQMAERYAPLAVVNELARLTPSSIRLLNLETSFNRTAEAKKSGLGTLVVQGIVFGESNTLETSLTSYLFSLRNSQLFHKPNILNKRDAFYNGQPVLRFNAKLELM